uniref:Uncharacterized protein n=1 Tax=Globodera rostochiensis TaxID=31243 RepID=A0A914HGW3_GLORO
MGLFVLPPTVPLRFVSSLLLLLLSLFPSLLAQLYNQRSAFALGVENGLGSFPIFGHRHHPVISSVPSFGAPNGGYTGYGSANFNTMAMRGLFPPMIGGPFAAHYATNQFLRESVFDRENFQARGCGWEPSRQICIDLFAICKGGCGDFSQHGTALRDCRCVPIGYSALLMGRWSDQRL